MADPAMNRKTIAAVILLAVAIAIFAGIFASLSPDGLEKVASTLGFEKKAASSPAVFIDYQLPSFPHPAFSTALAGIIGIIIIIFVFKSISKAKHIGEAIKKLLKIH